MQFQGYHSNQVPFGDALPKVTAIYAVCQGEIVHYVGKANDLHNRVKRLMWLFRSPGSRLIPPRRL